MLDHPLRLAVGSHPGSRTYACAMNVLSWSQGDEEITDLPKCTAPPLAVMVQQLNDDYCVHVTSACDPETGGYVDEICPSCAPKVLDLAYRTVGTGDATEADGLYWAADLLDGPHGFVHRVSPALGRQLETVAAWARRRADGCDQPSPPRISSALIGGGYFDRMAFQACAGANAMVEYDRHGFHALCGVAVNYLLARAEKNVHDIPLYPERMLEDAHRAVDAWFAVTKADDPQAVLVSA